METRQMAQHLQTMADEARQVERLGIPHAGAQRLQAMADEAKAVADWEHAVASPRNEASHSAPPAVHEATGFKLAGPLKPGAVSSFAKDRFDLVSVDIEHDIGEGRHAEIRKGDTLIFAPVTLGPEANGILALVRFQDDPAASFFGRAYVPEGGDTIILVSLDPTKCPIVRPRSTVTVAWELVELRRNDVRLI